MLKGKNTIRLTGAFVILVVIYLVIELSEGQGRSKSFRDVLVDIDTANITKVEILHADGKTVLTEHDKAWTVKVSDDQSRPVRHVSVNNFLRRLQDIKPSRLAARSKDAWQDFQVDSAGTRVVLYEGDEEALDIVLGRFDTQGPQRYYTYVRLAEDEDTYVANDFMKMSLDIRPDDFRNNQILKLERDSITAIEFSYPDSSFRLTKTDAEWMIDEVPADSAKTAEYLDDLRFITSQNFTGIESGAPLYKATYTFKDREPVVVKSFNNYVIHSSVNKHEYFSDSTAISKIFKGQHYFK